MVAAVLLAGCGTGLSSGAPGATPTAFNVETGDASEPSDSTPTLVLDPGLLDILPATIDGLAVTESPDGDQSALEEPTLDAVATTAISAVAVDTTTNDLAYALVVRLRPGALTDTSFRDWRDTYDAGTCGGASAVTGHAQTPIGGRTVFVGTCAGGLHTYHVWIKDKNLLITVSSLGSRNLGEALLTGLKP
jgi:hypothetical protein